MVSEQLRAGVLKRCQMPLLHAGLHSMSCHRSAADSILSEEGDQTSGAAAAYQARLHTGIPLWLHARL